MNKKQFRKEITKLTERMINALEKQIKASDKGTIQ